MQFDERVHSDSGLGDWFNKEKWVDISRKVKGKHPPCGASAGKGKRKKNPKAAYPKCRPAAEAKRMSKKKKKQAVSQKRRAESKQSHTGKGRKPIMTSHKKLKENFQVNEGKLKRTKTKNKPNNPKLWQSCIAAAKSKFDVYPCLPISYPALTTNGPKYFNELKVGDLIFAYDLKSKTKILTEILEINHFAEAPTLDIYSDGHYFCTATKNHKWVIINENNLSLSETQNLNKNDNIFVDNDEQALTSIEHETGSTDDVWCPTTQYNTWYTIINDKPCVTGNSAYANAWAAKEYKRRGGTWRKTKKKSKMMTESHDKYQTFYNWIEKRHPDFNQ